MPRYHLIVSLVSVRSATSSDLKICLAAARVNIPKALSAQSGMISGK